MKNFNVKEFRPTIIFLAKFIGVYLIGNLLYGLFVTSFTPQPDPITHWVSEQTGSILTACGWPIEVIDHQSKPTTLLLYQKRAVLSVFEGCNGINTIIIFLAFLASFGPISKSLLWFMPLGVLIIHVSNLVRISLLFFVAEYRPDFMYIIHKYFFTAALYVVIFCLWVWWIKKFASH